MQQAKQGLLSEKRLQVAATSVEAKDFFTAIVDGSPYSIAIHPDVSGEITLNLTDVTLTETLDVIQQMYGYEVLKKGNIIQVYPAGIRTETIALNYLFLRRFGSSSTSINSGGVAENDPNGGGGNGGIAAVITVAVMAAVIAQITTAVIAKITKVIAVLIFTRKMKLISGVN